MIITGIADEGSPDLEDQIRIHRVLGWDTLELRLIGNVNVCELQEEEFERAAERLEEERMGVVCFASPLANWARPVTSDFRRDVEDLLRSAPRMRRLQTRYLRIMSYPNDGLSEQEWRREAVRRVRELARIAEGEDVVLLHENCSGWGGVSPANQRSLLEEISSPHFQICFDTGNPVGEGHRPEDTWEFYTSARPYIRHIHIKDCHRGPSGEVVYTYPGEGDSMVREILKDAVDSGYDGAFSIEPHIAAQKDLGASADSQAEAEAIYLEYGMRVNALVKELVADQL
ncbi:MAG: sugar phosphate isomerase/epimerase [Spirochaetales bacterium]|nr:sugar phosphate isomerase/epimerase [Spirochaetales bacterium]